MGIAVGVDPWKASGLLFCTISLAPSLLLFGRGTPSDARALNLALHSGLLLRGLRNGMGC